MLDFHSKPDNNNCFGQINREARIAALVSAGSVFKYPPPFFSVAASSNTVM